MALTAARASSADAPIHTPVLLRNSRDHVVLGWPDGRRDVLHAVWLRDNCGCVSCRHPGNGQRFMEAGAMPELPLAGCATLDSDGNLAVTFEPDGHRALFTPAWLREHGHAHGAPGEPCTLWDRARMPHVPRAEHARVCADESALRDWLASVREFGVALLRGVPCEAGAVESVAELFGHVHETNYGRHFDVRSVAAPVNLAYTAQGLSVHTDNPYREPAPTLQLLHCLSNDAAGGETLLVDGFAAAERLRESAPHDFDLLSRWRVPFRYESADAVLHARALIIETDDRARLRAVRFNNRSVGAFDAPPDLLPAFYRSYRRFAGLLADEAACVRLRLAPGDLLLMDNRRVLHGRTAFESSGERWLQGCYADADALLSRLQVLSRERPPEAAGT